MLRLIKQILPTAALLATAAWAQQLPLDQRVRTGTLPNGLTYYVAHNAQTPNVADFYIAQRVGSILEEPSQRGLAHFLEHMAFNGSAHFPAGDTGRTIVSWCEGVGIKFGANLNAYTSVEQTVYNISSAPVNREGVIDTCLLILSDWSHDLLLSDQEIDKERGVVREEWRTRRVGMAVQRMMEDAMAKIYAGSKYADCLPIGNIDVINTFPYQRLRDFYAKWYRPDLQAIIVVGDVDADLIEQKIRARFGSIPAPVNATPRPEYDVPDNARMIVFTETDAEQPTVNFSLYMKRDALPRSERNTRTAYADGYKADLIRLMLNDRLQQLTKLATPPFVSASVRDGAFFLANTKDAFCASCMCRPDDVTGSIAALVGETERARRKGFTESELQRAKAEMLRRARVSYEERDKRRNGTIVGECVRHFTAGEPLLAPEDELRLVTELDAEVRLSDVNATAREIITDRNQVVTIYGPTKNGFQMPADGDIEAAILQAQAADYAAYEDKPLPAALMSQTPKAGTIVNEENGPYGYTHLTLSNGMQVYVRTTDFEADDVSLRLFSPGGRSLYPAADVPSLTYLTSVINASGVGAMDAETLDKMLAGKTVSVTPYVSDVTEGMRAHSSQADMGEMFQLIHLYFTAPRRDEQAFRSLMNRQRTFLKNRDASPTVGYNDSLRAIVYGNDPRMAPTTVETLDRVSLDRIMQVYSERFADAADFTAIITGSMSLDSLRPLLCTYLASLPATHSREQVGDGQAHVRPVDEVHTFAKKQATPAATTTVLLSAALPWTPQNDMVLDLLCQLLRMDYTEKVREEKGGTYGVSVSGDFSRHPDEEAFVRINFRCDPEKYDELIPIIYACLDSMAQYGPSAENLKKVQEYELKTYGQVEIMNNYWQTTLYTYLFDGVDIDSAYCDRVRALTPGVVRDFARSLLAQRRRIEVTMTSKAE